MTYKENLFSEFETVSANEWLEKVVKDLKGKPIENLSRVVEGIDLHPFYHQDNQATTLGPITQGRANNDWSLTEDFMISANEVKASNKSILNALENGMNACRFFIQDTLSVEDLTVLFEKIEPAYIETHFVIGEAVDVTAFITAYQTVLASKKGEASDYLGSVQLLGVRGVLAGVELPSFEYWVVENTDLSAVNQLSSLMNQVIETFTASNVSKEIAQNLANTLAFKITIGKDYFLEISKLRALRVLYANVLKAYDLELSVSPKVQVAFHPSVYDDTDPNQNLIGITTMTMAAAIGGANVITVLPADKGASENKGLYQRMARNVQHILKMESFLDRVVDPAAGSYYVEHLTNELCQKVWANIQA